MIFLSHKNDITEGSYIPLSQLGNKKVIAWGDQISLVSNICPHQKSLITTKSGKGNRICPYHAWTFNIDGSPVSSGRTYSYCKNHKPLDKQKVYEVNGLLFDEPFEDNKLLCKNLNNMVLKNKRIDTVCSNYIHIMNVFLDVDHIPVVHRGVYDVIGITDTQNITWQYFSNGSIQIVKDKEQNVVAFWLSIYPYTMIEWQNSSLFITVSNPVEVNKTEVTVFQYADIDISNKVFEENKKIWETAWQQDKNLSEILQDVELENLEVSKRHFLDWRTSCDLDKR